MLLRPVPRSDILGAFNVRVGVSKQERNEAGDEFCAVNNLMVMNTLGSRTRTSAILVLV